MIVTVFNN